MTFERAADALGKREVTTSRADCWRLRVYGARDVVGAAVLIAPDLALTCAHVVRDAALADGRTDPPTAPVRMQLVADDRLEPMAAQVLPDGWWPADQFGRGDLAVVRLRRPLHHVAPAVLAAAGLAERVQVRAYGHPSNAEGGVWATAEAVGHGGPGNEWIQLDGVTAPGRRIEGGFSGAGVVDRSTGRVVGLVIAEDLLASAKVAWMSPVATWLRYWPGLDRLLAPGSRRRPPQSSKAGPAGRAATAGSAADVSILARAVEDLGCARTPGQRDALVGLLPPPVRRSIPRHAAATFDVLAIVRTSLDYDRFDVLMAVLRDLEGESPAMARLETLAGECLQDCGGSDAA